MRAQVRFSRRAVSIWPKRLDANGLQELHEIAAPPFRCDRCGKLIFIEKRQPMR